jgi:multiple sugar transport system ATP-binding protein
MTRVELDRLTKTYAGKQRPAVDQVSIDIAPGELLVLVGPSGCGKSTALRMIAGLEEISSGELFIDGKRMNDVPPKDRDVAMVFQNYALYPHMTVFENMSFGLKLRKMPRPEIESRVRDTAKLMGLEPYLARRPRELSGGERQRVALGRALVRRPRLFLFDEPLSNLDAKLRTQVRAEIARLHHQLGTTMIYVTHDQVEAMTLGQRIAVLERGRLQQCADPMTLYRRPVNRFVAGFIGSPSMNFLRGRVAADGARVAVGPATVSAPAEWRAALASRSGQEIVVGVRPEHWRLAAGSEGASALPGRVAVSEPLGNETLVHVDTAVGEVVVRLAQIEPPAVEQAVALVPDPAQLHAFDPASGVSLLEEAPAAAR